MEEKNTETTTTISTDMNQKRGRPAGSPGTCSLCRQQGHNKATCPQKVLAQEVKGGPLVEGGPLAERCAQAEQALARMTALYEQERDQREMLEHGTEHVIYGIYNMEKDYACFSDPVYVGKSTTFQARASSHKSAKGVLKKMSRDDKKGVIVALTTKRFMDEEKGKKWVARHESYYMMKYKCHKYNPKSYNTNSVGTMDEQMKVVRKKKEALECLPMDDILRDEAKIEEWSRVLGNYGKYVQADQEAKRQSSSSSFEDGD